MRGSSGLLILVILLLGDAWLAAGNPADSKITVDPRLQREMVEHLNEPFYTTQIFIKVKDRQDRLQPEVSQKLSHLKSLLQTSSLSEFPRAARRSAVYEIRNTIAEVSQLSLIDFLRSRGYRNEKEFQGKGKKYRTLWVSNKIFVSMATRQLIEELSFHDDILKISGNYEVAWIGPEKERRPYLGIPLAQEQEKEEKKRLEWNIAHIRANIAWNITRGEGVVVANIDTGVRETHEALLASYRGNVNGILDHDYNWFDPGEFRNDEWWCWDGICSPPECCVYTPFDPIGHGTHCMGTMVGEESFGIGVAPGAKWIAAKGCRDGSCLNYGLETSAEWVICPIRLDGSDVDCSKGADVVSNSWGGGGDDDWYKDYTEAWMDAGMIAVFSQGNSGPRCETLGSPGDYSDVIGVGAVDDTNALADFSSRGPGSGSPGFSINKPEITAPGVSIRSASSSVGSTDNQKYSVSSGTSMAAPHVSAVITLMLSVNPTLSYSEVVIILSNSTNRDVSPPENGRQGSDECDGKLYDDFPSYHYGAGVIDAYNAVVLARDWKKKANQLKFNK